MTNTKLLNEKIKSSGLKREYIAKELGITRQSFTMKINNESFFNQPQIQKLCDILNITSLSEKDMIFFAN